MVAEANDSFLAIDFELANSRHDSACAVGLAACSGGEVVQSGSYLIRPPGRRFTFTGVHGLSWDDVREAPTFAELWPTLREWLAPARFVAAHNAKFDRRVLNACCARNRLRSPRERFLCTVELARNQWDVASGALPDVCRRLGIPLRHHDAGSDALACARIVLAARAAGWRFRPASRRKGKAVALTSPRP